MIKKILTTISNYLSKSYDRKTKLDQLKSMLVYRNILNDILKSQESLEDRCTTQTNIDSVDRDITRLRLELMGETICEYKIPKDPHKFDLGEYSH